MSALADLRRAMRSLARRPWFTVVAIASLAFGIGANATVFTIVNALLFRPLPYPDSGRLVFVRSANPQLGVARGAVTLAELDAIRSRVRSLGSAGVVREGDFNLTLGGEARRVRGAVVSAATLRAVGIAPVIGAAFGQDDDRRGAARVLVSDGLWRSALGAARDLGQLVIRVDGRTLQVAGVMPPGFQFPERANLWIPLGAALPTGQRTLGLDARVYQLVARLADDASMATARAELVALAQALDAERPASERGWALTALSAESERGENARPAIFLLFALVTCVLLVVCANLASLLVIRAATQRRELAIRSALGATHGRLVWHAVTESVILAAAGGFLAMAVAVAGVRAARLAFPAETLPFWLRFQIDWRVLAYSLGLAAATACAVGLLPAIGAARRAPAFGLASSSSRSATHSAERRRLGAVLVTGQVAVSLVLLVAAALLGAALGSMRTQDLGYDPGGLLTTDVEPRSARYADSGVRRTYFLSLAEQLRAIPGIQAVSGFDLWGGAPIEIGRENGRPVRRVEVPIYTVMPAYFETLRIRVRAGRTLAERDGVGAPPAAVVNETFARRFWPDEQAIGKRVRITGAPDAAQWLTVVGVVADVRRNPADLEWEPHVYLPASQFPPRRLQLLARAGSASIPTRALTDAARAVDPDEPLGPILTIDQQIGVWTAPVRFFATSLAGFAVVVFLIAIAGVYGVVSGGVTARTREFGIRLALGATPRHIVGIAVRRGARLAVLGAAVGLIGGVLVAQVLTTLPFGVERVDPRLVALAAAVLVVVALLAAYGPARRAGRLQPTVALGDDV